MSSEEEELYICTLHSKKNSLLVYIFIFLFLSKIILVTLVSTRLTNDSDKEKN